MSIKRILFILLSIGMLNATSANAQRSDAEPTLKYGASIYKGRCVLCHGNQGHGDGMLPLSIKSYPHTNLHENRFGSDLESIRHSLIYGGSRNTMSIEMPPWGDELTYTQINSVAMFVLLMLSDSEKANELLNATSVKKRVNVRVGRNLFKNFCTLCHGANGEGDGKMARIIKDPPPFNLTLSRVPDSYLSDIINKGGEAMGRSPRMPPWFEQLTKSEVQSVILYLKTLRK